MAESILLRGLFILNCSRNERKKTTQDMAKSKLKREMHGWHAVQEGGTWEEALKCIQFPQKLRQRGLFPLISTGLAGQLGGMSSNKDKTLGKLLITLKRPFGGPNPLLIFLKNKVFI